MGKYVMRRPRLTALTVESPRLDGRGVATRIFRLKSPVGELAHDGLRMTRSWREVKPVWPVRRLALTSRRKGPSL